MACTRNEPLFIKLGHSYMILTFAKETQSRSGKACQSIYIWNDRKKLWLSMVFLLSTKA